MQHRIVCSETASPTPPAPLPPEIVGYEWKLTPRDGTGVEGFDVHGRPIFSNGKTGMGWIWLSVDREGVFRYGGIPKENFHPHLGSESYNPLSSNKRLKLNPRNNP